MSLLPGGHQAWLSPLRRSSDWYVCWCFYIECATFFTVVVASFHCEWRETVTAHALMSVRSFIHRVYNALYYTVDREGEERDGKERRGWEVRKGVDKRGKESKGEEKKGKERPVISQMPAAMLPERVWHVTPAPFRLPASLCDSLRVPPPRLTFPSL